MTNVRRALVFDLDNTLILEDACTVDAVAAAARFASERTGADAGALAASARQTAEGLWRAAPVRDLADRFGVWWGEALWGDFSGDGELERAMRAFVPGFRTAVWTAALPEGRREPALAAELGRAFIAARRSGERIDPEAVPVLSDLVRDHRLALLTNGSGPVQREKLSRTPFAQYFNAVVVSGEVGIGKPDARVFEVTLRALGARPEETTMIGDSLARDVVGARAAGMRSMWLDRGLWQETDEPRDATVRRLGEIRAALDVLARPHASPPATS